MSGSARSATGLSHISTPDFRSPDFYALFVLGHPVFPALLAFVRPVSRVYCDMYYLGFCSVLRCCFNHFVASHLHARTILWTLLSSLISLCAHLSSCIPTLTIPPVVTASYVVASFDSHATSLFPHPACILVDTHSETSPAMCILLFMLFRLGSYYLFALHLLGLSDPTYLYMKFVLTILYLYHSIYNQKVSF